MNGAPTQPQQAKLIRHCEGTALALTALVGFVLSWSLPQAALAIGAGAAVTLADFVLLRHWAARTLAGSPAGVAGFVLFVLAKWTVLGTALLLLVRSAGLSPLWLGLGVSLVVGSYLAVALLWALFRSDTRLMNEPEPDSAAH